MSLIVCYANPEKSNSMTLCRAFALGAARMGARVEMVTDFVYRAGATGVFYGVQKALLPLWREALRRQDPYLWIDNGYFGSKWKGGDSYRITRNAMQHTGLGASDCRRARVLGVQIKPWRVPRHDASPLIALQSRWWYELHETTLDDWLTSTLEALRRNGWPEPEIRSKDDYKLPVDWARVSAVVTHSSNMAVDGLLEGVPAVCTQSCAGGYTGAKFSDWPNLPWPADRYRWAGVLADNQWRLSEIESGLAWRMLNR